MNNIKNSIKSQQGQKNCRCLMAQASEIQRMRQQYKNYYAVNTTKIILNIGLTQASK